MPMPAKPRVFRNIASGNRIKKRKNEQQGQNGIDFVGQPRAALHQQKENYDDRSDSDDAQCEAADVFEELVHARLGLTRIRLQLAIYFCLHRGKFAGKHCKLASSLAAKKSRFQSGIINPFEK